MLFITNICSLIILSPLLLFHNHFLDSIGFLQKANVLYSTCTHELRISKYLPSVVVQACNPSTWDCMSKASLDDKRPLLYIGKDGLDAEVTLLQQCLTSVSCVLSLNGDPMLSSCKQVYWGAGNSARWTVSLCWGAGSSAWWTVSLCWSLILFFPPTPCPTADDSADYYRKYLLCKVRNKGCWERS